MTQSGHLIPPTEAVIRLIAEALARGELAVIPTDTVYGVASRPTADSVSKLYVAKGRPEGRPIPLLIADAKALEGVVAEWPRAAEVMAQRFWPGALTIVVRAQPHLPPEITGTSGTVGVRIPDCLLARKLIRKANGCLAVTSANRSGEPPALSAEAAAEMLGDHVAHVLDGGRLEAGVPSTVVSVRGRQVKVIRKGAVSCASLRAALPAEAASIKLDCED